MTACLSTADGRGPNGGEWLRGCQNCTVAGAAESVRRENDQLFRLNRVSRFEMGKMNGPFAVESGTSIGRSCRSRLARGVFPRETIL